MKPTKRDIHNYPLNADDSCLEVYYDEHYRRLYRTQDGIPLDAKVQKVPVTYDAAGNIVFSRDDSGRILDGKSKPKPIPFDQFSRQQDRSLIEQYGAIANDIPVVVEAWRLFRELLKSERYTEIQDKLEEIHSGDKTDEFGLPNKRLFYSKMLSEIDAIYRLHPDYWQFRYDTLIERLQANTVPLGGSDGIATLKGGATPLGSNYVNKAEGVPFFRIQNIGDYGLILDDLRRYRKT